jgi:hypothetical protein
MYITEDCNGRVCSAHDTKCIEHFIWQAQWKEDNLVTPKHNSKMNLKQSPGQWLTLVIILIMLGVHEWQSLV